METLGKNLFHFLFLLETRDSLGKKYKGTCNLSCSGRVSAQEGRDAKIFRMSRSFLKIKGVRRKHVMLVQKANETNSHNSVSIWSTVDCWKRDWWSRTAAWKQALCLDHVMARRLSSSEVLPSFLLELNIPSKMLCSRQMTSPHCCSS